MAPPPPPAAAANALAIIFSADACSASFDMFLTVVRMVLVDHPNSHLNSPYFN